MFPFSKAKEGFSSVPQEGDDGTERDRMLDQHEYVEERTRQKSPRFWASNVPWICTTVVLSLYILASSTYNHKKQAPAAPVWSPTDLAISRPFIEERFQTFTVGLDYNNENHTLQHTPSNGPRYIGYPSDEIDDNWNALAKIQEIYLTKEEAIAAGVEGTYRDPLTGLYEVEIESLHHIHCLNYIRKSFDLDEYPKIAAQAETWRMHVDHCINSIREFIMCKADMTPIVLIPPSRFVSVPMPDFLTTHTCRNFEKLNHWIRSERAVGYSNKKSLELAKKIRETTGSRY